MDQYMTTLIEKRIEHVVKALQKNRMQAYYVKNTQELHAKIRELMPAGATTAVGGSMTLVESGVMDLIRNEPYRYIDRDGKDLTTEEEKYRRKREVYFADYFFTGTNAITESGELYNVDGMGSRVGPMTFGPANVIVIAGYNKIVKDYEAAVERIKAIAGPANNMRLQLENPCVQTGKCMDCSGDRRICSFGVLTGYQMVPDRIKVFLLPEEFGY